MSQLNIINVNIGLQTLPLAQKGFGLPLVAGITNSPSSLNYFEVSDADELLDPSIGYLATDPEYKMAQAIFSQTPRPEKIAVTQLTSFANIATDLALLRETKDNWYWLLITDKSKSVIQQVATYINSLEKVGLFATSDISTLAGMNEERAAILISDFANEHPEAAWFGRCGSVPIGSISWDCKQLSGQQNSNLTQSEQSSILAANGNVIRELGGVDVTFEGKTMSGQYIDIINGRDYLKARLIEAFQSLKINNDKVPMTQSGLGMLEASLREVFRDCGRRGVIATVSDPEERKFSDMGDYQYILKMPATKKEIPTNDRANRIVSGISFKAIVGGGINKIEINGTMGV